MTTSVVFFLVSVFTFFVFSEVGKINLENKSIPPPTPEIRREFCFSQSAIWTQW